MSMDLPDELSSSAWSKHKPFLSAHTGVGDKLKAVEKAAKACDDSPAAIKDLVKAVAELDKQAATAEKNKKSLPKLTVDWLGEVIDATARLEKQLDAMLETAEAEADLAKAVGSLSMPDPEGKAWGTYLAIAKKHGLPVKDLPDADAIVAMHIKHQDIAEAMTERADEVRKTERLPSEKDIKQHEKDQDELRTTQKWIETHCRRYVSVLAKWQSEYAKSSPARAKLSMYMHHQAGLFASDQLAELYMPLTDWAIQLNPHLDPTVLRAELAQAGTFVRAAGLLAKMGLSDSECKKLRSVRSEDVDDAALDLLRRCCKAVGVDNSVTERLVEAMSSEYEHP